MSDEETIFDEDLDQDLLVADKDVDEFDEDIRIKDEDPLLGDGFSFDEESEEDVY